MQWGDSVQWKDGTLATGPSALCEVQGYAYEAAIGGAELLEHFGRDGADWRAWAARLKKRFHESWSSPPRSTPRDLDKLDQRSTSSINGGKPPLSYRPPAG